MKATFLTTTFAAVTLLSAGFASAQSYSQGPAIRVTDNGTPAIYHHASTYEEGVLRGAADLVRARGDFNYNTSLAAINVQEARSRALDNARKRTETYFEMRRINRESRQSERIPRLTAEAANRHAQAMAPQSLSPKEYNPVTGRLAWPTVLQNANFAPARTQIDAQAASGRLATVQVRRLASEMQDELKSQLKNMSSREYLDAKHFLASIQRDAVR